MKEIRIGARCINQDSPVYFVADIAANHDGSLERATNLIRLAAENGADAAKFQNFRAAQIVSDFGFQSLGRQMSHQSKWPKSVYEVYEDASIPWEWTESLSATCQSVGIDYFSSPYDSESIDMLDAHMSAYKIGSGDITWPEILEKIASKGKPIMLATGASTMEDVQRAMDVIMPINGQVVLMQCNTNYTASIENLKNVHLNVLKTYEKTFPDVVLGLSDHTPGHATVLGAIALGARVVEKHFTDDMGRVGPDHGFSMDPDSWRDMVDRSRELESALGGTKKDIEDNERESVVVQRRCLRAARDLQKGTVLTRDMIDVLRPAPGGAILPYDIEAVIGMRLVSDVVFGEAFKRDILEKF